MKRNIILKVLCSLFLVAILSQALYAQTQPLTGESPGTGISPSIPGEKVEVKPADTIKPVNSPGISKTDSLEKLQKKTPGITGKQEPDLNSVKKSSIPVPSHTPEPEDSPAIQGKTDLLKESLKSDKPVDKSNDTSSPSPEELISATPSVEESPEVKPSTTPEPDLLKESVNKKPPAEKTMPHPAQEKITVKPPAVERSADIPEPASKSGKTEEKSKNDELKYSREGFPVLVNGKILFKVHYPLGPNSAEYRAKLVSEKLQKIVNNPKADPLKLKSAIDEKKGNCAIFYDNDVVFFLTKEDAKVYGLSLELTIPAVIDLIEQEIINQKLKNQTRRTQTGIIIGAAGLILLIIILVLLNKFYLWLTEKIKSLKDLHIKSLSFQKAELFSKDSILEMILLALQLVRISVIFLLIYSYFDSFLAYIPGTKAIRMILYTVPLNYLKDFLKNLVAYLPKLVFIIMSFYGTRFALQLTGQIFDAIKEEKINIPGFHKEYHDLTAKIAKFMLYFSALVLIVPNLPGYESPVFKGLSLLTGIVVSMGSTALVGNILAGINIVYTRAFKVGDVIQVGDNIGEVKELSLLATRLRTPLKTDISMPNSLILSHQVMNFSSPIDIEGGIILKTSVTIGYDAPGETVTELSLKAVGKTPNLLKDPPPFVLQNSLDDFYVTYWICAYTDKPLLMKKTYSELHKNIRHEFDTGGVEIMSPHYSTLRDGNKITIPESYLPKDYRAPGFNVNSQYSEK